jgi:hypothetical protein
MPKALFRNRLITDKNREEINHVQENEKNKERNISGRSEGTVKAQ